MSDSPVWRWQQRLEACQQGHEQRCATGLRSRLQAPGQWLVGKHRATCCGVAAIGAPRMVGLQLQHRMRVAELAPPIGQLALVLPGLQPLPLPVGVVDIGDGSRLQHRRFAARHRVIGLQELLEQHPHGPAVRHDVVHHHHQHMLARMPAHHGSSQQRLPGQVERLPVDCGHRLVHQGIAPIVITSAQIDQRNVQGQAGRNPLLHACRTAGGEDGAQRGMAIHQQLKACAQRLQIQLTQQPRGLRDVIGRTRGIELPQKPLPALRVGQGTAFLDRSLARQNGELPNPHAFGTDLLIDHAALLWRQLGETLGNAACRDFVHQRLPSILSIKESMSAKACLASVAAATGRRHAAMSLSTGFWKTSRISMSPCMAPWTRATSCTASNE